MATSINEIGRQVRIPTRIATEAVDQAEKTDARIANCRRPPTASATSPS
jgi:hypothetical protein